MTSFGVISLTQHQLPHFSNICAAISQNHNNDTKTLKVLDDFYPRALQWCSNDSAPDNPTALDISKCYPSVLIDNKVPIPIYTIHDAIWSIDWNRDVKTTGEYYIDEYVFDRMGKGIKIESGFDSRNLVEALIEQFKMPPTNVKWLYQLVRR